MSVWGPSEGALFGLAWAEGKNSKDFANERERLQRELAAARRVHVGAISQHNAATCLLNATVQELVDEQAGILEVKRFSDPDNRQDRVEAFIATAEGQLNRLSEGALQFRADHLTSMRSTLGQAEVGSLLSHSRSTPVAVNAPAKPRSTSRRPR